MKGFPHRTIPRGWYQVGWRSEFAPGAAAPLRVFDRDLVCYRTDEGRLFVKDAFCPHMGAHLGYGGQVEGDGIRCPFHGWKWGPDGENVDIPYSVPEQLPHLRLGGWELREVDGIVLVWFCPDGTAPQWEPAPFVLPGLATWSPYPSATRHWPDRRLVGQVAIENIADAAHFKYVHGAGEVPELTSFEESGPVFRSVLSIKFGAGAGATWATPQGPVDGTLETEGRGLGLLFSRLYGFDVIQHLLAITPLTADTADLRATSWVARERGDGSELSRELADRWVRQQNSQTESDIDIWENLSYVQRPPLARSEAAPMRALRAWAQQFWASVPESPR